MQVGDCSPAAWAETPSPTLSCRPMDANSGEPWSEADISDLKNEIDHGWTVARTASFLCRDAAEVRTKMKELGLQPGKRRVVR